MFLKTSVIGSSNIYIFTNNFNHWLSFWKIFGIFTKTKSHPIDCKWQETDFSTLLRPLKVLRYIDTRRGYKIKLKYPHWARKLSKHFCVLNKSRKRTLRNRDEKNNVLDYVWFFSKFICFAQKNTLFNYFFGGLFDEHSGNTERQPILILPWYNCMRCSSWNYNEYI